MYTPTRKVGSAMMRSYDPPAQQVPDFHRLFLAADKSTCTAKAIACVVTSGTSVLYAAARSATNVSSVRRAWIPAPAAFVLTTTFSYRAGFAMTRCAAIASNALRSHRE